jgi:hypothetical protein
MWHPFWGVNDQQMRAVEKPLPPRTSSSPPSVGIARGKRCGPPMLLSAPKQMPAFSDAPRLELVNSPLELVVCQLRFPMVLALAGGQPPEEFGRRIQGSYPVAKKKQTVNFEIVGESAVQKSSVTWVFEDQDSEVDCFSRIQLRGA